MYIFFNPFNLNAAEVNKKPNALTIDVRYVQRNFKRYDQRHKSVFLFLFIYLKECIKFNLRTLVMYLTFEMYFI